MNGQGANSGFWRWGWALSVAAGAALLAGCTNVERRMQERLSSQNERRVFTTLQGNMEATGGLALWSKVEQIEATAISTVFEPTGGQTLIEQHYVVRPFGDITIESRSIESTGVLTEQMDRQGRAEVMQEGAQAAAPGADSDVQVQAAALAAAQGAAIKLRLLAEGFLGATGLLREDYNVRYGALEQQGGRLMHKIELTGALLEGDQGQSGRPGDLLVIWIDADTMLYDRMWLRYHMDADVFGYMAVLLDEYKPTAQGLLLPRSLSFVRSDQYQQFSERRILLVELGKVEAVVSQKKRGKWGLGSLFSW